MDTTHRSPIWLALSKFYLDIQLQASDFRQIASVILESPYSLEEVQRINKYEVFPVLQANLHRIAGIWTTFDETWLIEKITQSIEKRNRIQKFGIDAYYWICKWMQLDYWEKLKKAYEEIKDS